MQIHHLASLEDWDKRTSEHYEPAGLASEGFIHLCTAEQLGGVVERYYVGRNDLVLVTVDDEQLTSELRWEDLTASGERFPHIYGALNMSAVIDAVPFEQHP